MKTLARGIRIDSSKGLFTPSMKEMVSVWKETLLDLVLLEEGGTARLWDRHWYFRRRPAEEKLRGYQQILRQFWAGDRGLLSALLGEFLFDAVYKNPTPWVVEGPTPQSCQIVPDYRIFALSLAFALNNFWCRLGVCDNPECKDYFVRSRKTQKFCDRPNCLLYGQRKYKREWWQKDGDQWRKNRAERQGKSTKKLKR
jgi:hypothetical protein